MIILISFLQFIGTTLHPKHHFAAAVTQNYLPITAPIHMCTCPDVPDDFPHIPAQSLPRALQEDRET